MWLIQDGIFMGVNLGSDCVAEHEWGINGILRALGTPGTDVKDGHHMKRIPPKGVYGIERRRCTPNKDLVALKEENKTLNLIVEQKYTLKDLLDTPLEDRQFYRMGSANFFTAWDENGLLVRVKGEDNSNKLRQLHEALMDGKCAIWLGGGWVFDNAKLCIAIIDAVPTEHLKKMFDADVDAEKLRDAAEETGIKKKVDEQNQHWRNMIEVETGRACFQQPPHGYFALSPAWNRNAIKKKSKHSVVFWLNPYHQDRFDSNWFSVEELEQWLKNKGPVLKRRYA
jgi:hypothetical protein